VFSYVLEIGFNSFIIVLDIEKYKEYYKRVDILYTRMCLYDYITTFTTNNMDDMVNNHRSSHPFFFICKFMACTNGFTSLRHVVTHPKLHT